MNIGVPETLYKKSSELDFQAVYKKETVLIVTLSVSKEPLNEDSCIKSIKESDSIDVCFIGSDFIRNDAFYGLIIRKVLSRVCKAKVKICYTFFEDFDLLFALETLREILLYARLITENQIIFNWSGKRQIIVGKDVIYEESLCL